MQIRSIFLSYFKNFTLKIALFSELKIEKTVLRVQNIKKNNF